MDIYLKIFNFSSFENTFYVLLQSILVIAWFNFRILLKKRIIGYSFVLINIQIVKIAIRSFQH